ncbi:histone H1-like [Protopterus annectens]|uniref:histone H1-like n=1 Tax=Protopterus annectens TaxID=7888 RepID=UPI001CFA3A41|nr:histone H1-like [Protopterus annectens]
MVKVNLTSIADTEVAPATAPTKPSKKEVMASKRKPSGPSMSDLTLKAVDTSKQWHRMSLCDLKEALKAAGYVMERNNTRLLLSLRNLVSKGKLLHKGSYKLNKKEEPRKENYTKKKSAAKVTAKKPKKAAADGSKKKTPKKPKKPAAAKMIANSPKKAKSTKPKVAKIPAKKAVKPKAPKPKTSPKAKKAALKAKK